MIDAGALDPAAPVVDALHALRFLENATFIEVTDGSHGPVIDDCLRSMLFAFTSRPLKPPDTNCVAKRPLTPFDLDGLHEILSPAT